MTCDNPLVENLTLYFSKTQEPRQGNYASTCYLFHPWWLISHIMKAVTAAIINNTYTELSIFIVLSDSSDDITYEQTRS
jgi:hypothetical protein